jgi:dephospho-CoA kinase
VVITNNGTLDELQQSIERAWDELQQRLHTAAGR